MLKLLICSFVGWIIGNCLFGMASCIAKILGGKENGNRKQGSNIKN